MARLGLSVSVAEHVIPSGVRHRLASATSAYGLMQRGTLLLGLKPDFDRLVANQADKEGPRQRFNRLTLRG